jgi:hypothetical protein
MFSARPPVFFYITPRQMSDPINCQFKRRFPEDRPFPPMAERSQWKYERMRHVSGYARTASVSKIIK